MLTTKPGNNAYEIAVLFSLKMASVTVLILIILGGTEGCARKDEKELKEKFGYLVDSKSKV